MGAASGLAGILSFMFVVLMTLGFLRSIYLTRDGFFVDEEDEDEIRNDHSLSEQTPEEFRRQQEADLEARMGRRGQRRLREEEEEEEELEGLFWDVELVFPARRQNRRQRRRNTVPDSGDNNAMAAAAAAPSGTAAGVSAGGGRRRFRLSELLFGGDAPAAAAAAAAPPRLADFSPGGSVEGGNSGEQRGGQGAGMGVGGGAGGGHGAGALDPVTRESFIHFVAKAGDGFAPPPAGEAAAAVAPAFVTTGPSARVAPSLEEQEEAGAGAGEPGLLARKRRGFSGRIQQPHREEETKDGLVGEPNPNPSPSSPPAAPGEDGAPAAGGGGRAEGGNPSPPFVEGYDEDEEWKDREQPSAAAAAEDGRTQDDAPSLSPGGDERRPASPGRVDEGACPVGTTTGVRSCPWRERAENRPGENARGEPCASRPGGSAGQGQERARMSPAQAEARSESREEREEGQEEEKGGGEGRHDTPATAAAAVAGGSESSGGRTLARESDAPGMDDGDDGRGVEDEGVQMEVEGVVAASLAAGATAVDVDVDVDVDVNIGVDAHGPGPAAEVLGGTVSSATAFGGAADAGAAGVAPETPGRAGVRVQGGGMEEGSAGDAVASASDRRPGSSRLSFNRSLEGKKLPACLRRRRRGSSIACPVCLDVFQEQDIITLVTCGHAFHWKCVEPWLERSARCPCCRQDLNALTANLLKSTEQWSVGPYHPYPGGVSSSSNNNSSGGWQHQQQQQEDQRPPNQ